MATRHSRSFLLVPGVVLALCLALLPGLVLAEAMSAPPSGVSAGTTGYYYVVQRGDTWANIAWSNGISVNALMAANPTVIRPGNVLWAGDRLFIPSGNPAPAPTTATKNGYWYTVKRGDTWHTVARATGVPVLDLWHANPTHIHPQYWLYTGERIWIPAPAPQAANTMVPATPTAAAPAAPAGVTPAPSTAAPAASPVVTATTVVPAPAITGTVTPGKGTPVPPSGPAAAPTITATVTVTGTQPALDCKSRFDDYAAAIGTYLNSPGATADGLRTSLTACGVITDEQGGVTAAGIQSKTSRDVVVAINPPPLVTASAAPVTPGAVAAGTQVASAAGAATSAAPSAAGATVVVTSTAALAARAAPTVIVAIPLISAGGTPAAPVETGITATVAAQAAPAATAIITATVAPRAAPAATATITRTSSAAVALPGRLLVYHQAPSGYVLAGIARGSGQVNVLRVEDINQDGNTDIVWTDTTCTGQDQCVSALFVDTWDGASYRSALENQPFVPNAAFSFAPAAGGQGLAIVIESNGGMPPDGWTVTYIASDGGLYHPAGTIAGEGQQGLSGAQPPAASATAAATAVPTAGAATQAPAATAPATAAPATAAAVPLPTAAAATPPPPATAPATAKAGAPTAAAATVAPAPAVTAAPGKCLYDQILAAGKLFDDWAASGFTAAIQAYQAALSDTTLGACRGIPDEVATLRDFARFRLIVSDVAAGQGSDATAVRPQMTTPALTGAADAFLKSLADSHSVVQACRDTTTYATAHPEAWQFMNSKDSPFAADDLCPLAK